VSAFSRRTEVHGAFFFFGESAFRDESERRYPDARKTTTHRARSRARRLEKRSPRGLSSRRRLRASPSPKRTLVTRSFVRRRDV
jgi:hypothetical protein